MHIIPGTTYPILQPEDQYIKLFNDSQASIQALNSHKIKSLAVKDTIIGQKVNKLEINWIKADVGHPGNERQKGKRISKPN